MKKAALPRSPSLPSDAGAEVTGPRTGPVPQALVLPADRARRMRRAATGLLVAMAGVFVLASTTRIGTWRSLSENLAALWSISPIVAIRIAWLSALVVTPSCAARSSRGMISSSGRWRSASMRGATAPGTVRI